MRVFGSNLGLFNARRDLTRAILRILGMAAILFQVHSMLAATLTEIDLNGTLGANPSQLIDLNGVLIFEATDGAYNASELWRSDGTVAGTYVITVISTEGIGVNYPSMAIANGALFFSAKSPNDGEQLYETNGTAAGTKMVLDINTDSNSASPQFLTNVNGTVFFAAYADEDSGLELWKTDGTAAGTVHVYTFGALNSYGNSTIANLTAVGSTLFFTVTDPTTGNELWSSDGTTAGTGLVKDIYPGYQGSTVASSFPNNLLNVDGTLYFFASGTSGAGLWKSDGTEAGTVLIQNVDGADLINVGTELYFNGNGELWKSDGTTAGTVQVKNIFNGSADPEFLTAVGTTVFFTADDLANGQELWESDGTEAGTVLVDDIDPGSASSFPIYLTAFDNLLFCTASDGVHGREIWFSNGTAAGTQLLADIDPNEELDGPDVGPQWLTPVGDQLFFSADDNVNGYELWVLNTALPAPTVVTGTASNVGSTTATLNGSVNPNGSATISRFHYGLDTTYGSVTATQTIGSGTSAVLVSATITGLLPAMEYHFEVTGSNGGGVAVGDDMTFTTPAVPGTPKVVTDAANNLGTTTATLNGSVNPEGEATTAYVEYGPDTTYGMMTSSTSVGAGSAAVPVSFPVTGFQEGTTYHFRAFGVNATGTSAGQDQMFTTVALVDDFTGKYAAVFSGSTNATTGVATISVTKKGAFTASVEIGGRKESFAGKFGLGGSASVTHAGIPLALTLSGSNGIQTIIGSVGGTGFVAQALFAAQMTPMAYTVELPPPANTSLPQGSGYGALTVSKRGEISLAGELGDGTPYSAKGGLTQAGTWPFYASLYGKQGYVVGTVTLSPTNGTLGGAVEWLKPSTPETYTPGNFLTSVNLSGVEYVKQAKGMPAISSTNGVVDFEQGNLATSPLEIDATLDGQNKFAFPMPADDLKMKLSVSNGLFSGSFKDPATNATRKFHGAVLQFQGSPQLGVGVFKGSTEAGSVELFPPLD